MGKRSECVLCVEVEVAWDDYSWCFRRHELEVDSDLCHQLSDQSESTPRIMTQTRLKSITLLLQPCIWNVLSLISIHSS